MGLVRGPGAGMSNAGMSTGRHYWFGLGSLRRPIGTGESKISDRMSI